MHDKCGLVSDPHSVVRLSDTGMAGSQYINANYIRVSYTVTYIIALSVVNDVTVIHSHDD